MQGYIYKIDGVLLPASTIQALSSGALAPSPGEAESDDGATAVSPAEDDDGGSEGSEGAATKESDDGATAVSPAEDDDGGSEGNEGTAQGT